MYQNVFNSYTYNDGKTILLSVLESVLGYLLFLIFTNDFDFGLHLVNTFLLKFADDTKLGSVGGLQLLLQYPKGLS